jgi:hypothetical protein
MNVNGRQSKVGSTRGNRGTEKILRRGRGLKSTTGIVLKQHNGTQQTLYEKGGR